MSRGAITYVVDAKVPGRPLARITEAGTRLLRERDDAAMTSLVMSG